MITIINGANNTIVLNGRTMSAVYEATSILSQDGDISKDEVCLKHLYGGTSGCRAPWAEWTINGVVPTSARNAVELLSAFVGNFKSPGSGGGSGPGAPDSITDVTALFQKSVEVPNLIIEKHDRGNGIAYVRIVGQSANSSGADLVLTAPAGMGSLLELSANAGADSGAILQAGYDASRAYGLYPVTISKATDTTATQITIPNSVEHVDFMYFIGETKVVKTSYYVDLDGVSIPFSFADTPIENFCDNNPPFESIIIGGNSVPKSSIVELVFGDDYNGITNIPIYFCYYLSGLTNIDLSGLKNVETISQMFLVYTAIRKIDLSPFANKWQKSDGSMCYYDQQLSEIQIGSLDINNVITGDNGFSVVMGNGTIYADTQQLGEDFKSRFERPLNGWTVVVNS